MKKFYIRKVFPYDPTLGGAYSRYDGYKKICLRKLDPGISSRINITLPKNLNNPLFTSEARRAIETGKFIESIPNKTTRPLPELNEILFDLQKLTTRAAFEKFGSSLVREKFIQSFVDDSLEESRDQIKQRVESLLRILKAQADGNYLLVSHSFFMKILQIFLANDKLFSESSIIYSYFNSNIKTFEFGSGFNFEL